MKLHGLYELYGLVVLNKTIYTKLYFLLLSKVMFLNAGISKFKCFIFLTKTITYDQCMYTYVNVTAGGKHV